MKSRIFISMHYMHLGGAEISLIGLLQALNPNNVDVDLFVYSHEGEMMSLIPDYVNLLSEREGYNMFERPLREVIHQGAFRVAYARLMAKIRMWKYEKTKHPKDRGAIMGFVGEEVSKVVPDINPEVEYDLAISFLTPHNFVRDHVRAKKKICWIHTDYTCIDVNEELELPVWDSYDYVVSISPDVTNTFLQVFPSLSSKIIEVENILSPTFVCLRAKEFVVDWDAEIAKSIAWVPGEEMFFKVLSIGRFSEAKNYDNVPDICRRIVEMGICIKWFIIGYGGDEQLIRDKIVEAGMQKHVIILGKRSNPYPYIKACDIYVQPSRYEGKSVTVREAQVLCKPVVVTDYPTAKSQIRSGVDGVIVPMDNENCAKGLREVITNSALQQHLIDYLKCHDYGNESEVEKIYSLMQ